MQREDREDEDDAWRAIVENYGDHPTVEAAPAWSDLSEEPPAENPDPEDSFVPPEAPRIERTTPPRTAAWSGLFLAPGLLLLALLLGISLPAWVGYLLVAWFVGGFGYLVATMPRGARDPGDDGARL